MKIDRHNCAVVAEAGQTMEGSVDRAIAMAEDFAKAGCAGFKVQLLRPDAIATNDAPKYWHDDFGTRNQREAFTEAGLVDYGAWAAVKDACDDFGITFFATPFDLEAVVALEAMDVECYKIASGDITHRPLIEAVGATGRPVILSTGASTCHEIDDALRWGGFADRCVILACTLSYPTRAADALLARIETLRKRFGLVGYSDHTTVEHTAFAAAAMGACLLEKHVTHDRAGDHVPDHAMALDADGMGRYVEWADRGAEMRGSGTISPTPAELAAHRGARRSIYAAHDLAAGHRLRIEDLAFLRPGGHRDPGEYCELIDVALAADVEAGEPL